MIAAIICSTPDRGGRRDTTIAIAIGIAIATLAAALALGWRAVRNPTTFRTAARAQPPAPASGGESPQYSNESIERTQIECCKLAFSVASFDDPIDGEHAAVLKRVSAAARRSIERHEHFPRRPLLLPRLLRALNDSEVSRQKLVQLLLEDPALAGSVLQRANSTWYRVSPEPVDSLDRAVVLLGTDGLRSLAGVAILQPVFRLPKGCFESFATVTWEQAQRAGLAAQACARAAGDSDPFVAQLLGLLGSLARIVLFRLTMDAYRERPNVPPRAEVFIRCMQEHGAAVARRAAQIWELSDASIAALEEQERRVSPAAMSPLGQAVYYGELCGALALLHARGICTQDDAHALLQRRGLSPTTITAMWSAAGRAAEE
ncbi:MAG TPA: HDOD domain-containing protein [Steroidobacter sp.]|nr:HDOD domain-containing protein [Steroidobacter sp.]